MLDPISLLHQPDHASHVRSMTPDRFLDFALTHLAVTGLACFLDSAGPLHTRSRYAFLSGPIRGYFLQAGPEIQFHDFQTHTRDILGLDEFSTWLKRFHSAGGARTGATLFPLLTYEAFPFHAPPDRPHPLWNQDPGIWLLAEGIYVYDRLTQTLCWQVNHPGRRPWETSLVADFTLGWRETETAYGHKIQHIQNDIREGNYYQANLSQRFLCETNKPPLAIYRALRMRNPSPFMGIFRWGDHWILSGSPERLLAKRGEEVSSRPIAGTKPRLLDPDADTASRHDLLQSEKERAEHVMLVDLIRNDLGKVAVPGSVDVREFCTVETYSHVHHLVSEVSARLRLDPGPLELIAAMFPGGTITGAPKMSCMRRLAELEGEARGPYTGSLGYIDTRGRIDLNILIRTLIQYRGYVCFHGGGGIVADSTQSDEYKETRQKCLALMEALGIQA